MLTPFCVSHDVDWVQVSAKNTAKPTVVFENVVMKDNRTSDRE